MTHGNQSQEDVFGLIKPLTHPKYTINMKGSWNIRTLYRSGNITFLGKIAMIIAMLL